MNAMTAVLKRELRSYFLTPVAYVFIVVFLVAAMVLPFLFLQFYERNEATLETFFAYHPVLYLFLVPALGMRLWAEERKSGSIELLMTLPIELWQAVVGKFLAAWAFTTLAIALTFPIWITVNYLGDPDNGVILAAYIGSALMAGGYLAIASCLSAITKNQVIAFVVTVVVCFFLMFIGFQGFLDVFAVLFPQAIVDAIAGLSLLTHFENISRGVLDLRDVVYYGLLIGSFLYANTIVLGMTKAR